MGKSPAFVACGKDGAQGLYLSENRKYSIILALPGNELDFGTHELMILHDCRTDLHLKSVTRASYKGQSLVLVVNPSSESAIWCSIVP